MTFCVVTAVMIEMHMVVTGETVLMVVTDVTIETAVMVETVEAVVTITPV